MHRVETALGFLSIAAIAPEIRSLKLSLQIDVHYYYASGDEIPPSLPWHSRLSSWLRLRDRLLELENLRYLNVWLDAASGSARIYQLARYALLSEEEAFNFDARLVPFLRVSIPLRQHDDGTFHDVRLGPREYIVGRGDSEFWQEPSAVPDITWYGTAMGPAVLMQHFSDRRYGIVGGVSRAFRKWRARRQGEEVEPWMY